MPNNTPYLTGIAATQDSQGNVLVNSNFVFTFDNPIQAGTGSITISRAGFSESISVTDHSQVSISANTLTLNPSADLPYLDGFTLTFSGALVQGLDGTSPLTSYQYIFSVPPDPNDHTAPTLVSITPADNSTDVPAQGSFQLQFNEQVALGPSAQVKFYTADGTFAFDATGPNYLNAFSNTVSVAAPLQPGKSYYAIIDPGAITDRAGNPFAGITSPTAFSFSTYADNPTLQPGEPANGQSNVPLQPIIDILFNKTIHAGTGNIRIYRADGTLFESIPLSDTTQVTVNEWYVELRPNLKFAPNTSYYILLDAGAVVDDFGIGSLAVTSNTAIAFGTGADTSVTITSIDTNVLSNSNYFTAVTLNSGSMVNRQAGDSFLNDGTILITSNFANSYISGVEIEPGPPQDQTSTIANYGQIHIEARDASSAYGIRQDYGAVTGYVSGPGAGIFVAADNAHGYASYDAGKSVVNAGPIEVTGRDSAIGIDLHDLGRDVTGLSGIAISGSVINTGSVTVASQNGSGNIDGYFNTIAINLGYGQLNNSGTIHAQTGDSDNDFTVGVRFNSFAGFSPQITNSGDISAHIALFDASIVSNTSRATSIVNSGTIEGLIVLGSGNDTLTSTNAITGNIAMGAGADILTNSGSITGDVALGAGNDTFNGGNGSLNGTIDAGTGNDTIYAGRGTYSIDGGDGNDTVAFSGASTGYTVTTNGPDTIVSGANGTVTIAHVENITFSDKTLYPAASGLQINISYDSSAANAPAAFKQAISTAVQDLEQLFSDPITLNVEVGYGEVAGQQLDAGAIGEAASPLLPFSYSQVLAAMAADGKSQSDATALLSLTPDISTILPSATGVLYMTQAEAKALGLDGGGVLYDQTDVDGIIGFDSTTAFDFNAADGISAGSYDFTDLVIHELTHVMGRSVSNGGSTQNASPIREQPLDLFHFSAPGAHILPATTPGYFSIDNGVTNLADFNSAPPGDPGDWAISVPNNAFDAYATPGVNLQVTPADLTEMDILGWDLNQGATINKSITGGPGNDTLTGTSGDDILRGNGGTDSLDGGGGNDTVAFSLAPHDYYVSLNSNGSYLVQGPGESDTLINIENASFDATGQTMSLAQFASQSFNPLDYIASYPDLIKGAGDNQQLGLQHFMQHGYYEGRSPGTFNVLQYIASYPDLIKGAGDNQTVGLEHYILHGYYEGRVPTFNVLQYIASYPDLVRGAGDNQTIGLEHYILHGYYEGRVPTFNALQYIASYPDLIRGAGDNQTVGLEHYILHGYYEGRTATFNALDYVASYADLIKGAGDNQTVALEHYILHGFYEGRTVTFDPIQYIASYDDLIRGAGDNATVGVEQYILHGFYEGRTASFDAVAYLLSNPDLQNGQYDAQAAELQFVQTGFYQGRSRSGAFGTEQTQHALTLGVQASDNLATSGDEDWFSINLTAGQSYNLTLSGNTAGGLTDPYLELHNANGVLAAQDNDSGPGTDALIHFNATTSGLYYLVASSNVPGGSANYKVLVAPG